MVDATTLDEVELYRDPNNGQRFVARDPSDGSIYPLPIQDLETNTATITKTLTDPSGTSHTGTLAELSDVPDTQTLGTPITALDPGDSYEFAIPVPDGEDVKLKSANAVIVDETATGGFTTDANLVAEIVDESGTIQYSSAGINTATTGNTLYKETNTSGGIQIWKVRVNNTDGSATFDSPGALGSFSVVTK